MTVAALMALPDAGNVLLVLRVLQLLLQWTCCGLLVTECQTFSEMFLIYRLEIGCEKTLVSELE